MGALRVWRWVSGTWRPGFGAGVRRRDAGFGTEARRRPQPQASSKSKDPVEHQPFPGLLRTENLGVEELVDVLKAAVVDQKGPLVTLNKPQGLPVTGRPGKLTLLSVLPQLSQALGLGHRELQVVRAPGKEASGLVLLSGCPQTASRLQKFFAHSRRSQRPTATYCAITDGIPEPSEGTVSVALKLERKDGIDLAVPVASPSRKDILEGVKRTLSHFHVMATGCGCALVQLQPLTGGSAGEMKPVRKMELGNRQRASGGPQGCVGGLSGRQHSSVHTHSLASRGFRSVWLTPQVWWDASCHCPDLLMGLSLKAEVTSQIHRLWERGQSFLVRKNSWLLTHLSVFPSQLQVHMALQLCPVLGDHTYAARVGTVLGQRFLWPATTTKPQTQVLDEALLKRLRLSPSQVAQMPLHLHLQRLLLPGTRSRDPPSELLVPVPSYFSRTLQCLRLSQK